MPSRPTRPEAAPSARFDARIILPDVVIPIDRAEWFRPLEPTTKLKPGAQVPKPILVPAAAANAVLRGVIHLVADLRADAPPTVVWVRGSDELLVLLDGIQLTCAPGFVTIRLVVQCDQVPDAQRVDVAFAVGSKARPSGLLMSTFDRVQGPALITNTWSAEITAFAWEALLTTATQLAAGIGKDANGRALLPASIAADKDLLMIGVMARHNLGFVGQR
jgi:hypothetical protein